MKTQISKTMNTFVMASLLLGLSSIASANGSIGKAYTTELSGGRDGLTVMITGDAAKDIYNSLSKAPETVTVEGEVKTHVKEAEFISCIRTYIPKGHTKEAFPIYEMPETTCEIDISKASGNIIPQVYPKF